MIVYMVYVNWKPTLNIANSKNGQSSSVNLVAIRQDYVRIVRYGFIENLKLILFHCDSFAYYTCGSIEYYLEKYVPVFVMACHTTDNECSAHI